MSRRMAVELQVSGMSCAHCVRRVTEALEGVPGVVRVTVDLDTEWALVSAEDWVPEAELVAAVAKAGYEARVAQPAGSPDNLD